jgi:glycosyltransferase involved in cell wall biosynthesis
VKILIIHDRPYTGGKESGGAESFLSDLEKSLCSLGHEVSWATTRHEAVQKLSKEKYDIVNIGTIHDNVGVDVAEFAGRFAPVVWTLMDYWPFCHERMLLRNLQKEECPVGSGGHCEPLKSQDEKLNWHDCAAATYVHVVNNADCVIAFNEQTAEIYKRHGIRVDRIVHLGVDDELFKPGDKNSTELTIATVCAWPEYPTKGVHILKEAIEGLDCNVKLVTRQPRVKVAKFLETVDIFIFPSTYHETWGLCLNEALAAGCAVITSDVAGALSQVEDGVNGLIVPRRDAKSLRAAIDKLMADEALRVRLGNKAREIVKSRYNLNEMAKRFTDVFKEVRNGTK